MSAEQLVAADVSRLKDKDAICALVHGWMHRDLGEWKSLSGMFHPEGVISVTWFQGSFQDFVQASMRMGASSLRSKHLIGVPIIRFGLDRATAESNAVIVLENADAALGCNAHARLFDWVERRDGTWKILKRYCFYDMSAFTFPFGVVSMDQSAVRSYPQEYASLAYLLDVSGFPIKHSMPTRGSSSERQIKEEACRWVDGV